MAVLNSNDNRIIRLLNAFGIPTNNLVSCDIRLKLDEVVTAEAVYTISYDGEDPEEILREFICDSKGAIDITTHSTNSNQEE